MTSRSSLPLYFSLALAIFAGSAALSRPPERDLESAARQIIAAANTNDRAMEILKHLTDVIGPRLSGSPQAAEAVRWTAERMKKDGFENVTLQPVTVPKWVRGVETGELLTPSRQRLPLTALGGSVGTPEEGITAEIIEVSNFEELSRLGEAVKGKIVYYHTPLKPDVHPLQAYGEQIRYRSRGAVEAAKLGAAASMIRSLATGSLGTPHTGATYYVDDVPRIPHAALATEAGDLLHRLIASGEKPTVRLVMTCRPEGEVESANVIGEIRGRERPDEIVVVGAHLDSWDLGTGAFDDAVGSAIAMETPRLLKELGLVPRRTIRTVLFMTEEIRAPGAKRYADMGSDELERHVAAIEADAGADDPVGFRVSQQGRTLDLIRQWAQFLDPIGAVWVDYGGPGGLPPEAWAPDLAPLEEKGVLAIALRNDPSRYFIFHHSDGDTFDKVNAESVKRNLAAMAFMAYAVAESEERFRDAVSER